jgi:hypothetical protein
VREGKVGEERTMWTMREGKVGEERAMWTMREGKVGEERAMWMMREQDRQREGMVGGGSGEEQRDEKLSRQSKEEWVPCT